MRRPTAPAWSEKRMRRKSETVSSRFGMPSTLPRARPGYLRSRMTGCRRPCSAVGRLIRPALATVCPLPARLHPDQVVQLVLRSNHLEWVRAVDQRLLGSRHEAARRSASLMELGQALVSLAARVTMLSEEPLLGRRLTRPLPSSRPTLSAG